MGRQRGRSWGRGRGCGHHGAQGGGHGGHSVHGGDGGVPSSDTIASLPTESREKAEETADPTEPEELPKYPENTATEATKILARQGWDASKLSRWGDETEVVREALAWCASHARVASIAEKALVHELEAEDAQVKAEQEALERRLKHLRIKQGTESTEDLSHPVRGETTSETTENMPSCQDVSTPNVAVKGALDVDSTPEVKSIPPGNKGSSSFTGEDKEGSAPRGVSSKRMGPESPGREHVSKSSTNRKEKKKKTGGIKKSKAQQVAEKEEAERLSREKEVETMRLEAEAAAREEALLQLHPKPRSKAQEVTDLLRVKLQERLELCHKQLVLLRRARDETLQDNAPTKALGDPDVRPSERQANHDSLLAKKECFLLEIKERIKEVEARMAEAQAKLNESGGSHLLVGGDRCAVWDADGRNSGWACHLDDECGRYYWYNDTTGEAFYDDERE